MQGILIVNTGTPQSVQQKDVRQFIGDMLSDPKLIDLPNPFRWLLARCIIAPKRQAESTLHYQQIWDYTRDASPLLYHTQNLCKKLEEKTQTPVEYAFRYGHPNATDALSRLEQRCANLQEVVVMHMFPHFAQSSFQTAIDSVIKAHQKRKKSYKIRIIAPYYNHPAFIDALSQQIQPELLRPYDKLIFSYHSLPLKHIAREEGKGEAFDYSFQTQETLRLVAEKLSVPSQKQSIVYSSAIADDWMRPFLDDEVESLAKDGTNRIVVACAGFPIDNLESLFDIGVQAKKIFEEKGGKELSFVRGLNDEPFWIDAICQIIGSSPKE